MSKDRYRDLIRQTMQNAISSTKTAHRLLVEHPADYHVLKSAATQLHQAARTADKAIGIIEAHRALTESEDPT